MEMKNVEISIWVKLSSDPELKYQVIEINPKVPKPITIRRFGDGFIIHVNASEIEPWE